MTTMTLAQFQATGRPCDDLGAVLEDDTWAGEPFPGRGRLYLQDQLYIEWRDGEWSLPIGDGAWTSTDLASLEERLYQFAVDELLVTKEDQDA